MEDVSSGSEDPPLLPSLLPSTSLALEFPPRPASAPPQKDTPRRSASYNEVSNLASLEEHARYVSIEPEHDLEHDRRASGGPPSFAGSHLSRSGSSGCATLEV